MKVVETNRKETKPRWLKVVYIIAIIALIIIALNIALSFIASKKLHSFVNENKQGLDIDIEYTRVNILNRSIKIGGISVSPDTIVPDFNIAINVIKVSGIGVLEILSGDSATIRKILIEDVVSNGDFEYLLNLKKSNNADTASKSTKPFSLDVHKIILDNIRMDSVYMPGVFPFQNVSGLNMKILDVKLNISDGETSYAVGDAILNIDNSKFLLPGEYYNLEFYKFNLSFEDSVVGIDSFRLIPNYGFYEFGQKKGKQTDRFVVGIDKLVLSGFDFNKAVQKKGIFADKLILQKLFLKVFRDKRLPFDYNNYPPLPQQALNRLKFPLNIKVAKINNMFVEYSEINDVSDKPGFVSLNDLNISIENIANKLSHSPKDNIVINGKGLLYGSGKIVSEYIFPINAENDTFFFNGTAENFEMSLLNKMVTPLTSMEITGGMLHKATFNGSANPVYSGGTFEMLYNDLSFEILRNNSKDEPEKPKGFLSFLAKSIVRSNNPTGHQDPKIVGMFFKRDPNKGFFNFYWKTILSGIRFTALPGNQIKAQDEILPPKTRREKREAKKEARKEERELKRIKK